MRWGRSGRWDDSRVWHLWFAWHPVTIDSSGQRVWLEYVERKNTANFVRSLYDYIYRNPAVLPKSVAPK